MAGSLLERTLSRGAPTLALVASLAGGLAAPLHAQDGNGFLLQSPVGSFGLRVGYNRALASSDVFRQNFEDLTLSKGDFGGLNAGADLSFRMGQRFDLDFGVDYAGSSAKSRFRHYLDNNDAPIEQETKLRRAAMSASVKAFLAPRGRSVGQFAWIPNKVAPYVGVGGGTMWYGYRQAGDFVDFATNNLKVFSTTFRSSHWTPEAHAMGGTEYSLSPRVALTGEARYTWARAPLGSDFQGFDRIDLSGVSATAGLSVRF
jgi:hypothetical protein